MTSPDLSEALDAATQAYMTAHWTERTGSHTQVVVEPVVGPPTSFDFYRVRQALLPILAAAAPFILSQCPCHHDREET